MTLEGFVRDSRMLTAPRWNKYATQLPMMQVREDA